MSLNIAGEATVNKNTRFSRYSTVAILFLCIFKVDWANIFIGSLAMGGFGKLLFSMNG